MRIFYQHKTKSSVKPSQDLEIPEGPKTISLAISLINRVTETNQTAAVIALDAEKVLDMVSWNFLKEVLLKMAFGDYFVEKNCGAIR